MTDTSPVQLRRWTREEYDRMIDAGVLTPEDRVELIEGDRAEVLLREAFLCILCVLCILCGFTHASPAQFYFLPSANL
jgi:hypothetical protein